MIVFTQREVIQEHLLGVEEKLYKVSSSWCKRSCTHLAKGVLSSGVQVLVLGVSKSGKGKSQADCLGIRRRSQGPNQDKISYLWFVFSEFFIL